MYYETVANGKISNWLFNKFLEWQKEEGSRKPQAKFAKYLGIKPSTFSMWITGKQDPDPYNADKLAAKLGPEIYEILDIPAPPEFIQKLESIYDELTPNQRQALKKKISDLLAEYSETKEL